jgi:8-oxo-dGTP diphosphatase
MAIAPKTPDWLNPPVTIRAVICHVTRDDKFLLQLKSKGRFGEGYWNAPGGKIEAGESADEAAKREVYEETGLVPKTLEKKGDLEFYFGRSKKLPDWTAEVFLCSEYEGELDTKNSEGELKWFRRDEIPYERMWADDKYWLPMVVETHSSKPFHGVFVFSDDSKDLLESKVQLLT